MNIALPTHMTVDEFLAWAVRQEKGRYELFKGRVVMHADTDQRETKLKAYLDLIGLKIKVTCSGTPVML